MLDLGYRYFGISDISDQGNGGNHLAGSLFMAGLIVGF